VTALVEAEGQDVQTDLADLSGLDLEAVRTSDDTVLQAAVCRACEQARQGSVVVAGFNSAI
jgi:FXSXX-COOH protein